MKQRKHLCQQRAGKPLDVISVPSVFQSRRQSKVDVLENGLDARQVVLFDDLEFHFGKGVTFGQNLSLIGCD